MGDLGDFRDQTQLIKCAGFGGQGILALGEIIAIAAMHAGRNVSWLPSYGPESRGGTCNCDVILSEGDIAAPFVDNPNIGFVFNQPSMDKFEPSMSDGGILFYDSSLASIGNERETVQYLGVPFTKIAIEIGTEKIANMVAIGAYVGTVGSLDREKAVEAMKEKFTGKERFFSINEEAIAAGMDYVSGQQAMDDA